MKAQGLISPDDSRYQDPQNLLVGNVLTGGMLPWIQATADVASGRVPQDRFDEARQEHARRLEELKQQHPEFVAAAEKAMPFLEGLGLSVMKPASTVAGTMARGAAAALPQGVAHGYSSGPIEEPSASGERTGRAVGQGAIDASIGAAGASVPAIVSGARSLIGKTTTFVAERAAQRTADAEARRSAAAAESAAQAKIDKKTASTQKAQTTKLKKKQDIEFKANQEAENKQLMADYQRYTAQPQAPAPDWEANRKLLMQDPVGMFNKAAEGGWGLEGLARGVNMSPAAVYNRMTGVKIKYDTAQQEQLYREGAQLADTITLFKKRGLSVGSAPGTNAGNAGGTAAPPAGGSSTDTPAGNAASDAATAKPKPKPRAKPAAKPRAKRKPPAGAAD